VPLPADRAQAVERSLAQLTGRTVTMETRVDPALIGGVVARIGSIVYDGSIATQLQKIKQKLVERV
jgi:F-type H+-transporting ATPase subunit delta